MLNVSAMRFCLVYDLSGGETPLWCTVNQIKSMRDAYKLPFSLQDIKDDNDKPESGVTYVYLTHIYSEQFYNKVRQRLIDGTATPMHVLLSYPTGADKPLKKMMKNMKTQMKKDKRSSNDIATALAAIIPLKGTENVTSWWPRLLNITRSQLPGTIGHAFGVYFLIDHDNVQHVEWMDRQSQVLGKQFSVGCRSSASNMLLEDKYIQNSVCVVVYVSVGNLNDNNNPEAEGQRKLRQRQDLLGKCKTHDTKLILYADGGDLGSDVGFEVAGTDGMMSYWLCLLDALKLGRYES